MDIVKSEDMSLFDEMIETAKKCVILRREFKETTAHKWLEAYLDSYNDADYRIRIFVMEGSPAQGYVIANYGQGTVQAFNIYDESLKKWTLSKEREKQQEANRRMMLEKLKPLPKRRRIPQN